MTTEGTGVAAAASMLAGSGGYMRFAGLPVGKSPEVTGLSGGPNPAAAVAFSASGGAKFSFIDALNQSKSRKIQNNKTSEPHNYNRQNIT